MWNQYRIIKFIVLIWELYIANESAGTLMALYITHTHTHTHTTLPVMSNHLVNLSNGFYLKNELKVDVFGDCFKPTVCVHN